MRRLAALVICTVLAVALSSRGRAAEPAASTAAGGPANPLDGLLDGFRMGGDRGPVHINSDTMEFDYKTKVLTYRGAVTVTQADMILHSDVLTVSLDPEKPQRPRTVVAEGSVQIDKGQRRATGGRAVFDDAARTVTLSDQAKLKDGQNEVAGEKVVVYLDEERSVVEGGRERVRAVLYPSSEKGTATAEATADGR